MNTKFLYLVTLAVGLTTQSYAAISTAPVTKDATEGAKKIYDFLYTNFGKKTVSGVMCGDMDNGGASYKTQVDVTYLHSVDGGKYPALVGVDFLNATGAHSDEGWYQQYTSSGISLAKELYKDGGIPSFCWHWRPGNEKAFYDKSANANYTLFDYTKGFKSGTTEWDTSSEVYKTLINDIDIVSNLFLDLQKSGVAAVWRPLHEAAGGWFWWGTKGAESYVALYRLMYDRMVNVNGVKNLIWVWNLEKNPTKGYAYDETWYPGDAYVDVIGVDLYNGANNNSSNISAWNTIVSKMGANHLMALTENGPIVDPAEAVAKGDMWSWWMPWYNSWGGGFIDQTSKSLWQSAMSSDAIITLDEMPGWGTYVAGPEEMDLDEVCATQEAKGIYEVECSNDYQATEVTASNKSGKGVLNLMNDDDYINLTINLSAKGSYKVYVGYNSLYGFKQINCAVNGIGGTANLGESADDKSTDKMGECLVGTYDFAAGANTVKLTPIWTWAVVDYVRIEKDNDAPVYEFKVSDVDGIKVDGAKVLDHCGNEFVMRGVNMAYTWFKGSAYNQLEAIHKYGANAVRIVLGNGVKYNNDKASEVLEIVNKCKEYGMVAILEVHDVTGSDKIDDLLTAANYFANLAPVLKGTEPYVIINIANEWHNSSAGTNWRDGYVKAIPVIRNAGLRHCIMVDAGGYGQSAATIHTYGKEVMAADVDNNILFSIHMYGGAGNTNKVVPNIDGVINQGLALCIGEFGWFHSDGDVDEEKILSYCNEKNVGWLAWSWVGNGSPVEYLDVVKDQTADPVLASYNNISISNWNNTQTWKASADWGKTITDAWKAEAKMAVLDECTNTYVNELYADGVADIYLSDNSELNIEAKEGDLLVISDAIGRVVYTGELQHGTNKLEVSNWTNGIYFANIDGKVFKFIKK
ncbi:MAG: cellulase family glycosylhydrolase [Paludibacteraceae bacterium]|nr:cellulase family glycosylhydrolase [Paludibacteraceae bacterium]